MHLHKHWKKTSCLCVCLCMKPHISLGTDMPDTFTRSKYRINYRIVQLYTPVFSTVANQLFPSCWWTITIQYIRYRRNHLPPFSISNLPCFHKSTRTRIRFCPYTIPDRSNPMGHGSEEVLRDFNCHLFPDRSLVRRICGILWGRCRIACGSNGCNNSTRRNRSYMPLRKYGSPAWAVSATLWGRYWW